MFHVSSDVHSILLSGAYRVQIPSFLIYKSTNILSLTFRSAFAYFM